MNPPSSGMAGGPPMGGPSIASGPGPSLESFKKDGFNLMGSQQQKKQQDEEGAKEFADLFNLADSKIKDRVQP